MENKTVKDSGKLETQGISSNRPVRESVEAAFVYFAENSRKVIPDVQISSKNYLLYYADIQGKGLSDEVSLAEFIGLCSALVEKPVLDSLAIAGEIKLSGTLNELNNLEDVLRVSKNAGAKKVLLPMDCIKDMQTVPRDLISKLQPIFYNDPVDAAKNALDLSSG